MFDVLLIPFRTKPDFGEIMPFIESLLAVGQGYVFDDVDPDPVMRNILFDLFQIPVQIFRSRIVPTEFDDLFLRNWEKRISRLQCPGQNHAANQCCR